MVDTDGLLRHECKVLAIFLDVELRDRLIIKQNVAGQRIVKSLNKLDAKRCQQIRRYAHSLRIRPAYTVLFPQPLAPTKATYVPGSTVMSRPRSTRTPGRVG